MNKIIAIAIGLLIFGMSKIAISQESLIVKIDRILSTHELMRMVGADVESAKALIGSERSAYFPKLTFNAGVGSQTIDRDVGVSGSFRPQEAVVGLNQLVTDFSLTTRRVNAANTIATKEMQEASLQRQNLLLAALEAQLMVIQADRILKFAIKSENNIKHQAALESIRVEVGKGYASDVLQAKAQLSGAQARRIVAENRLDEAFNRYYSVFREGVEDISNLQGLLIPDAMLPNSLDDLNQIVVESSPDVIAAKAREQVSLAERDVAIAKELAPRLDLQVTRANYQEFDGVLGSRSDTKAMLRFGWSFELGMKSLYVLQASDQAAISSEEKAKYVKVQALEEAKNAWVNWQMAKKRFELLTDQVNIANKFVEVARKEREFGRRSLIDILNGEITLINAQSDATTARIDQVIASLRLLRSVGKLEPEFLTLPGVIIPAKDFFPTPELMS